MTCRKFFGFIALGTLILGVSCQLRAFNSSSLKQNSSGSIGLASLVSCNYRIGDLGDRVASVLEAKQNTSPSVSAAWTNVTKYRDWLSSNGNVRRDESKGLSALPELLIPAGGQPKGTVILFHGFSATPCQMAPLAAYLMENNYLVLNANVAGQAWVSEPGNANSWVNPATGFSSLSNAGKEKAYFDAAEKAFSLVKDATPGNIYVGGLSAGATMALSIGAVHKDSIKRVVALTPLLAIGSDYDCSAADSTKLREMPWATFTFACSLNKFPTYTWGGNKFSAGAFKILQYFAQNYVFNFETHQAPRGGDYRNGPGVFMVTTQWEDAADTKVSEEFYNNYVKANGNSFYATYSQDQYVPHPISAIARRSKDNTRIRHSPDFSPEICMI